MKASDFKITPQDLLPLDEYVKQRPEIQKRIFAIKAQRRVEVGPHMSFHFENKATLVYQIQEMMRVERLTQAEAIAYEIDTYQELMPAPDTLSATLMLEYPDVEERRHRLRALKDIVQTIYLWVEGRQICPTYDPRQVGEDRASAVQFLKFRVGQPTFIPKSVKLSIIHAEYHYECNLTPAQVQSIWGDLQ